DEGGISVNEDFTQIFEHFYRNNSSSTTNAVAFFIFYLHWCWTIYTNILNSTICPPSNQGPISLSLCIFVSLSCKNLSRNAQKRMIHVVGVQEYFYYIGWNIERLWCKGYLAGVSAQLYLMVQTDYVQNIKDQTGPFEGLICRDTPKNIIDLKGIDMFITLGWNHLSKGACHVRRYIKKVHYPNGPISIEYCSSSNHQPQLKSYGPLDFKPKKNNCSYRNRI
ncbi:hypothetical protein L9F63_023607, partial [Diploptera punctata]